MLAILFDLDGTLIDSAPDIRLATNRVLAEFDRDSLDLPTIVSMIGDGAAKLVERAFTATGGLPDGITQEVLTAKFLEAYDGHETDTSAPFEGAIPALETLKGKGHLLAVCTNKPQAPTEAILKDFGMDHLFDAVIGGDAIPGVRKPDARHLQAGLEALSATPDNAIMVGDGDNDLFAARNAGIPVIIVSFGYNKRPLDEMAPDAVLDDFNDLESVLKPFTKSLAC